MKTQPCTIHIICCFPGLSAEQLLSPLLRDGSLGPVEIPDPALLEIPRPEARLREMTARGQRLLLPMAASEALALQDRAGDLPLRFVCLVPASGAAYEQALEAQGRSRSRREADLQAARDFCDRLWRFDAVLQPQVLAENPGLLFSPEDPASAPAGLDVLSLRDDFSRRISGLTREETE